MTNPADATPDARVDAGALDASLDAGRPRCEPAPAQVAVVETPPGAYDVALAGDTAYVATWEGVAVLDLSDPLDSRLIGSVPLTFTWSTSVAAAGDLAIVRTLGSLRVVDCSDPANHRRGRQGLARLPTESRSQGTP